MNRGQAGRDLHAAGTFNPRLELELYAELSLPLPVRDLRPQGGYLSKRWAQSVDVWPYESRSVKRIEIVNANARPELLNVEGLDCIETFEPQRLRT